MKNIILIFAVGLYLQYVSCNSDLLAKFHQNGYKIKDVRIQLMDYDKDYFNICEVKVFKYNRTTTAHNVTINFKIDAKDDLEVLVQTNKFLSNEYRRVPMRFQLNIKKAVDSGVVGLDEIQKCSNFKSFYFSKNISYKFCNFVVDEQHMPPLLPNGRYKVDAAVMYFNKEIAWVALFGEVYTPIPLPTK